MRKEESVNQAWLYALRPERYALYAFAFLVWAACARMRLSFMAQHAVLTTRNAHSLYDRDQRINEIDGASVSES